MSMELKINNETLSEVEKQINRECKKLEKYFLADPKVDCKIFTYNKGICVKVSLDSGNKHFLGEACGMQINLCINKAVKRLMRQIGADKNISLRRNDSVSIKKFNFELLCDYDMDSLLQWF